MIGGSGDMLFSIHSHNRTKGKIEKFLWWTSEARDNRTWANFGKQNWRWPLAQRVWLQKRLCVYVQNVTVCTGTTRTCFNTRARGARIHVDVCECTHGVVFEAKYNFSRFFQRAATHKHVNQTHHDHQQHHDHNGTHHTTQHTTTHGDRERQTDRQGKRERQKERQRNKTEKERVRERERQDKRREERREKMKERRSEEQIAERSKIREGTKWWWEKDERKVDFFWKMLQNPQTRQRKTFSDELFLHFSFDSSESDRVFSYLHDSNSILRVWWIKSENFFGYTVFCTVSSSRFITLDVQSIYSPSSIRDWHREVNFWATDR